MTSNLFPLLLNICKLPSLPATLVTRGPCCRDFFSFLCTVLSPKTQSPRSYCPQRFQISKIPYLSAYRRAHERDSSSVFSLVSQIQKNEYVTQEVTYKLEAASDTRLNVTAPKGCNFTQLSWDLDRIM